MEKSEVVAAFTKNKKLKVSNKHHIPDDLSFYILCNLPLKSLKRFGCVKKSWDLLFQNPNFMSMYSKNFLSNDCSDNDGTCILLSEVFDGDFFEGEYLLYSLSGERFENIVELDWPNPFLGYNSGFNIWGSSCINGILCLECNLEERILLWNLGTKECKVIPSSPLDSVAYWEVEVFQRLFGYDPIRDDYKVIRYIEFSSKPNRDINGIPWEVATATDGHIFGYDFIEDGYKVTRHVQVISEVFYNDGVPSGVLILIKEKYVSYDSLWEVYSLRSNSWRKLDVDMPYSCDNHEVYLDGMSHWRCTSEAGNETYLVSFDLGTEVFFTTPIPSNMIDGLEFIPGENHLLVLNGSVALILKDIGRTSFHIFILGDVGAKESWTRIFIVEPLPCILYPIGAVNRGIIYFNKKDGGLVRFDLTTQMIEELNVITTNLYTKVIPYKENLLPLGGIDN